MGFRNTSAVYSILLGGQTFALSALFWIVFSLSHQITNHLGKQPELRYSEQIATIASAIMAPEH